MIVIIDKNEVLIDKKMLPLIQKYTWHISKDWNYIYKTPKEASIAYKAAIKYFGDFARLN